MIAGLEVLCVDVFVMVSQCSSAKMATSFFFSSVRGVQCTKCRLVDASAASEMFTRLIVVWDDMLGNGGRFPFWQMATVSVLTKGVGFHFGKWRRFPF